MSTNEVYAFDELIDRSRAVLQDLSEIALDLADQNKRFVAIGTIPVFTENPEIEDMALNGLAEEQLETFIAFRDVSDANNGIFEALGRAELDNEKGLPLKKIELEELEQAEEEKAEEIKQLDQALREQAEEKSRAAIEATEKLSPRALERVKEYLGNKALTLPESTKKEELERELIVIWEKVAAVEAEIEVLETRTKALAKLGVEYGVEWPIPLALWERRAYLEELQLVLDELPVDPKLSNIEHQRLKALRERHVDAPEASLYIALYLSEHSDRTITVGEIAKFLYPDVPDDPDSERALRSRVTTLLGPKCLLESKSILETLLADGLVLQYGWRSILTIDRQSNVAKVSARHRIYRTIPVEEMGQTELEDIYETDEYRDRFESTPELQTLAELVSATTVSKEAGFGQVEHGTRVYQEGSVKDSEPVSGESEVEGWVLDDEIALEDINQSTTDTSGQPTIKQDPSQSLTQIKDKREDADQWERHFKANIGDAIDTLYEWGLLESRNSIPLKTARSKSDSAIFASHTAIRRLVKAHLADEFRQLPKNQVMEQEVSPRQMILMLLFNRHLPALGGGAQRQQKKAIALIDQALDSFFTKQERELSRTRDRV